MSRAMKINPAPLEVVESVLLPLLGEPSICGKLVDRTHGMRHTLVNDTERCLVHITSLQKAEYWSIHLDNKQCTVPIANIVENLLFEHLGRLPLLRLLQGVDPRLELVTRDHLPHARLHTKQPGTRQELRREPRITMLQQLQVRESAEYIQQLRMVADVRYHLVPLPYFLLNPVKLRGPNLAVIWIANVLQDQIARMRRTDDTTNPRALLLNQWKWRAVATIYYNDDDTSRIRERHDFLQNQIGDKILSLRLLDRIERHLHPASWHRRKHDVDETSIRYGLPTVWTNRRAVRREISTTLGLLGLHLNVVCLVQELRRQSIPVRRNIARPGLLHCL